MLVARDWRFAGVEAAVRSWLRWNGDWKAGFGPVNADYREEEVSIDPQVRAGLDVRLLALEGVASVRMLGGAGYTVEGRPFAALLEGVVAMRLPEDLRARALTLAGVSPFISQLDDDEYARWVQFLLLLPEDIPAVLPWLEAAYGFVSTS